MFRPILSPSSPIVGPFSTTTSRHTPLQPKPLVLCLRSPHFPPPCPPPPRHPPQFCPFPHFPPIPPHSPPSPPVLPIPPPPFPLFPPSSPLFQTPTSRFGELVSSVAVDADACGHCPLHLRLRGQGTGPVTLTLGHTEPDPPSLVNALSRHRPRHTPPCRRPRDLRLDTSDRCSKRVPMDSSPQAFEARCQPGRRRPLQSNALRTKHK